MTQPFPGRSDVVARTLARNRLGVPAVIFFVMSAAAPLTVVAGVVTTGFAVTGITGLPLAFVAIGLVLAVFSVGYVAMARRVANAGAFYAYVAAGLGRPLGVGAAWVAVLAYNALQVGLYGAIGAAGAPLVTQWFGVDVAWWVFALAAWALVAVLGVLRVDVNGTVLAVLLLAEIAAIVVFDLIAVANPAGGTVTFATLAPGNLLEPGVGAILALAMLGFVGFESAVVFSEESKDPARTVRAATYTSVGLIAALYAVSAWAMTVAIGPDRIVDATREQGPEVVFALGATHLGGTAADIGHALFLTSLIAAMISFHNTTARYTFALGREGVLPTRLGDTSRAGAPKIGSLLQSLLGLAVIVGYAVAGWDPLMQLFFWGGTGGGYGVLLLTTLTSIAVIAYFARHDTGHHTGHGTEHGPWQRTIAPVLAAVALLVIAWLATVNFDTLLGVAADSPVRTAIPAAYGAAALAGIGWALILRHRRPQVYARIGLGAKAATTGLGLTVPEPRPAGHPHRHQRREVAR
jgi:amino acid transporter